MKPAAQYISLSIVCGGVLGALYAGWISEQESAACILIAVAIFVWVRKYKQSS
jgi:uncharacterized membrane protein YfcA